MKVTILMMLPFYFGSVCPTTITTAENTALLRGTSKELICKVNSGSSVSSWTFTAYQGSIRDVTICSRGTDMINNITSFRKMTDENGTLSIRTESAQPQDAGVYKCNVLLQVGEGKRVEQYSAHLIILDSDPKCTTIDYSNDGRKYKQLSCSVGFRGSWAPVMEWRNGSFNGPIVRTGDQGNSSSNVVSHSLTIPSNDGKEDTNSYTCVTFFSAYMGTVNVTADNIPKYTYKWSDKPGELPVPANAVVIQGSNSTMVCKKSSTATVYNWTFTAAGSSSAAVIFTREKGIEGKFQRHQYSDDHASCKLSIEPTRLEDAGKYTCTKPGHSGVIVQESAQLIVFESDPKCRDDKRQEDINGHMEVVFHLSCTVVFRGNFVPKMEWRFNDVHGEIIKQRVFESINRNRNVTSSLVLVASSTRRNSKYVCRTFFENTGSSVTGGSADNIPVYSYTWPSPVINKSNDVSMVTLIVSLAVVVIAILVILIVYHVVFKSLLAGRHQVPPVVVMPSFQTVQESEYAAIRETETSTGLSPERPIDERRIPETLQEGLYQSVAYGELQMTGDSPPHLYRKLPLASLSIPGSSELHPYMNVPMSENFPTPTTAVRPDGNTP